MNLSKLTDEELRDFMDSVYTDEEGGDFSSEDDLNDPTYEPAEISPEYEQAISECLRHFETSEIFFAEAPNLSLNISEFDLPST